MQVDLTQFHILNDGIQMAGRNILKLLVNSVCHEMGVKRQYDI